MGSGKAASLLCSETREPSTANSPSPRGGFLLLQEGLLIDKTGLPKAGLPNNLSQESWQSRVDDPPAMWPNKAVGIALSLHGRLKRALVFK